MLIILLQRVAINYRKKNEEWLSELMQEMARKYADEGQFTPGSMLPKVQGAVSFAESRKGRCALITLLEKVKDGIAGKTCTIIKA